MILRPTKIEDISRVIDIINQAKTYFKNNDIGQWQDGYPNEETIEKDIENNEAMMIWKTTEEFMKQLEVVKKTLREWWDKELYAKWYCMILEESNVFNITWRIVNHNSSKYQDTDVRILWFDLWKLDDSAALILYNLTHREIEESRPVYNATYWTQLRYAKEYKQRFKNI